MKWIPAVATVLMFGLAHTGGLVWYLGRLGEKVANQTTQIIELKEAVRSASDDRYRATDARRDFDRIDEIQREFQARLQAVEVQVRARP